MHPDSGPEHLPERAEDCSATRCGVGWVLSFASPGLALSGVGFVGRMADLEDLYFAPATHLFGSVLFALLGAALGLTVWSLVRLARAPLAGPGVRGLAALVLFGSVGVACLISAFGFASAEPVFERYLLAPRLPALRRALLADPALQARLLRNNRGGGEPPRIEVAGFAPLWGDDQGKGFIVYFTSVGALGHDRGFFLDRAQPTDVFGNNYEFERTLAPGVHLVWGP